MPLRHVQSGLIVLDLNKYDGNPPGAGFANALGKSNYSQICTCNTGTEMMTTNFHLYLCVIAYPGEGIVLPAEDKPHKLSHSSQQGLCLGINIQELCSPMFEYQISCLGKSMLGLKRLITKVSWR